MSERQVSWRVKSWRSSCGMYSVDEIFEGCFYAYVRNGNGKGLTLTQIGPKEAGGAFFEGFATAQEAMAHCEQHALSEASKPRNRCEASAEQCHGRAH